MYEYICPQQGHTNLVLDLRASTASVNSDTPTHSLISCHILGGQIKPFRDPASFFPTTAALDCIRRGHGTGIMSGGSTHAHGWKESTDPVSNVSSSCLAPAALRDIPHQSSATMPGISSFPMRRRHAPIGHQKQKEKQEREGPPLAPSSIPVEIDPIEPLEVPSLTWAIAAAGA